MTDINVNPLLKTSKLADEATEFSKIKTSDYMPALQESIRRAKANIEKIKSNPAKPNFENVILALQVCHEELDHVSSVFGNLEIADGTEEMHKLAPEIYQTTSAFVSDMGFDAELFAKVKVVEAQKNELNLTPEQIRLIDKIYKNFVRNGALATPEQQKKLREIDQELAALSPLFSENVLKATNKFELWVDQKEDLEGIPEGAVEAAAHAAQQKGEKAPWLFTLQYPSYIPLITYAKNRNLRYKMWQAASTKAFRDDFDNQKNILRIVHLRHQRAQILGFKSHADFVLKERMAQSPQTVTQFLERMKVASLKAAQKDLEEVKAFAQKLDGISDFKPWDFAYYSEKLKAERYAFNAEDLRPYFQLEKVVEGVFTHARKLYGLVFKENSAIETYHSEMKAYDVVEEKTGRYMGIFYTDFFPRKTKKDGAWMTQFREQGIHGGKVKRPHVSIVCNFTRPTPTKPSLLSYDEVRTLFHEFGHALHGMLSDCTYTSLSGPNVYWDFVELPSQIMENWVAEKEGLDLFAKHYQTGETLPTEMIEKLKRSQKFQAGWSNLRQLQFSALDMAWHSTDPATIKDVEAFETEIEKSWRVMPKEPGTNMSCSFSHIFTGGYSAGYYSYKWAEVLDADAFEYFQEKGIFNTEVSKKFKDFILSKGDTEHPMELYKKFRGREPDPNALLRRDGLME